MTQEEAAAIFRETGALLEGHFLLSSGLHSPRYIQCARVLQYPIHAERLCGEIASHFRGGMIDAVIAPALGGIVVAQEVGRQLNARTMFAERSEGVMLLRRGFEIRAGERVLVCEDVITTGGSVLETVEIVRKWGGILAGIGAVVDRSGGKAGIGGYYTPLTLTAETYPPGECPLCAAGVPIVKPGSRTAPKSPQHHPSP